MSLTSDTSAPENTSLRSITARHRLGLALSAVFAIIAGACSLAPYVAVYAVTVALFDDEPTADTRNDIWRIAALTAVAIAIRALASAASTHTGHVAAYRILADLRIAIARTLTRLPLGRVQARSTGQMKKLLHDDVEQLEEALAHGVPDLAAAAAVPLATTALFFVIDWRIGCIAVLALLLLVVISGLGMKAAMSANEPLAAHAEVQSNAVMGYLRGIKVIRGYLRPDSGYDQARSAIITGARLQQKLTAGPVSWVVALMSALAGLAVALLLPTAGHWFLSGDIGLGTFALSLLLGLGYLAPIMGLVGVIATIITRMQFAAKAVTEILDEPALPTPAETIAPESFTIALREVTFRYSDDDEAPALRDVTLTIPAGSRVGLVGPTGAGKSTVARLIARFWDVSSGAITIGGVDVRSIAPSELAQLIAFVQQDEYIFAASLRENVRIARPGADDAAVEAACRAAELMSFVGELPDGLDTELPAGGGSLSGGQRQRISIARALLKDAPIVVLDEATASLDAETEALVLTAIERLTAHRTVVAIAHRLDTIRSCETIVHVRDGAIAATGSHDQLLATDEEYRALWHAYTRAAGWRLAPDHAEPTAPLPPVPSPPSTDDWDIAARDVVTPGIASMSFGRQWRTLIGRGWQRLTCRALVRLIIEGSVRSIPLLAVYLALNAAVGSVTDGRPFTMADLWQITGLVALGMVLRLLANHWVNAAVWPTAAESKADLQLSIIERLRRVPLGFFGRVDNSRVATLVNNDIIMVDFQNVPQQVMGAFVSPVYITIALLIIDWRLGLAAVCGIPLFLVITGWADRIYHRVFTDVFSARDAATTILVEQASGAAVLRGNPGSMLATRFESAVIRLRDASIAMSVKATPATALGSIAVESGIVVLIVVGSALYVSGSVTASTLLLFLVLSLALYQPIQDLNVLAGYRRNQQQIAARIADVWDAPTLSEPTAPARPAHAGIEFRDVRFGYTADTPVLDGVSFTAQPGTITAIIGSSGSGKSTLANLAARLWDTDEGAVLIGGVDVRDLGSDEVMNLVTTVYQDVYLFHETVRYNVSLGRPEAIDDELWEALRAAQCDDVVRALPEGLDTMLADGGTDLSGGQRQRLSIARALVKNSPILVLDEAVAAVDPDTEARIQDALATLAAGRTVLVIAHRLETVRDVDQIITVADGRATVTTSAAR